MSWFYCHYVLILLFINFLRYEIQNFIIFCEKSYQSSFRVAFVYVLPAAYLFTFLWFIFNPTTMFINIYYYVAILFHPRLLFRISTIKITQKHTLHTYNSSLEVLHKDTKLTSQNKA